MCSTLVPTALRLPIVPLLAALLGAASGAGCMTKQQAASLRTGQGEAMPVIDVQPGVAERIALMDSYRLHDETRRHMMRHPHVTIEELPPEEQPPAEHEDGETSQSDAAPPP